MALSFYFIQQIWTVLYALILLYKEVKTFWALRLDASTGVQDKRLSFVAFFTSELILADLAAYHTLCTEKIFLVLIVANGAN